MVKAHTFDNRRHMVTNFFVVTPPKLFSEFHGYDDNLGNLSSHLSEAYESFKGVDGTVLALHRYVQASGGNGTWLMKLIVSAGGSILVHVAIVCNNDDKIGVYVQ